MRVGGLFAGIGGIELGFKNAGFDIEETTKLTKKYILHK
jgi:site-specific DNA-cytosine methylase